MRHPSDPESLLKLFWTSNQLAENDLTRIEDEFQVDLGRRLQAPQEADEVYYPQFEDAVRREAAAMARHYEIFYCLERTIRTFINSLLNAAEGPAWWNSARVPQQVKDNVQDRMKREVDAGVTLRSADPIDFTTFGELGEIIRANWDIFGGTFSSQAAVTKVMTTLNTLRGPIAHCSPLADDEVIRLQLSVRDWFRLME
jgi:hypothetical protein